MGRDRLLTGLVFQQPARSLLDMLPCAAEIIFVNDGSSDRTLVGLYEASKRESRFNRLLKN